MDGLPDLERLVASARRFAPDVPASAFELRDEGESHRVLIGGGRVHRFPRDFAAARRVRFEGRLLAYLADRLDVPVPRPVAVGRLPAPKGRPFLVYDTLAGRPLSFGPPLDRSDRLRLGTFLRRLLRGLAALPEAPLLRLGAPRGDRTVWARGYRRLERRYGAVAERTVPPPLHDRLSAAFERFQRDLRRSGYRPVATHRDLTDDHLLWSTRRHRPTGVIDWEDFCLGDPAFDLVGIGPLVPETLPLLLKDRARPGDPTFGSRLAFYRAVAPLHGLLFDLEHRASARRLARDRAALARSLAHGDTRGSVPPRRNGASPARRERRIGYGAYGFQTGPE